MKIKILQQAYQELDDAVGYYEKEQAGLGFRMMEEVDSYISWVQENPRTPRLRKGGYRQVNLKTFPYYIAYLLHQDTLWIIAIAHGHRKPEYWVKRKNQIG